MARKRKADDDGEEMSVSPLSSPRRVDEAYIPPDQARPRRRRGRPPAHPPPVCSRRSTPPSCGRVLQRICESHPDIGQEVVTQAPAAHGRLGPVGSRRLPGPLHGRRSVRRAQCRVRLLPRQGAAGGPARGPSRTLRRNTCRPIESQAAVSLQYLDGATKFIHSLPDWEPPGLPPPQGERNMTRSPRPGPW